MHEAAKPGPKRTPAILALSLVAIAVIGAGGWTIMSILNSPPAAPSSTASPTATPQTVQEILDAARVYLDQDKAPAAEIILTAAVERIPDNQSLRLLLGECLLQQDRLDESYDHYTQGIFIGPDHPEYRFVAGTIASKLNRLEDAETHYKVAQSMDRSNPKFPLYLAQVQRKMGKADDARASLVIATKLDETLSIAWATLAAIALDENRQDVAKQYISRARALEPDRPDFRVIEAKILRRGNEPQQAADLLLAIPEADRLRDQGALLELSLCFGMLGKVSEAAAMYVSALALNPDDPELAYQAAIWLDRDNQRGRAETYAQHAATKGHEGAKKLVEAWK
jgi:tetratricopeptide (TPR) repeat protein